MKSARTNRCTMERNVVDRRLENDEDLRKIYEFEKKLGKGSSGVVHEVTHIESQTKWAIKEICKPAPGSSNVEMVENEIRMLKQINHTSIIHLEAVYRSNEKIYLITELCKGGDLKQLLDQKKFFTEDETKNIMSSLADAVAYLHERDIVHRDLKLDNILVKTFLSEDDGRIYIKVADFGVSIKKHSVGIGNMITGVYGTPVYMAPEMLSSRGYSKLCDAWSLGVIMYLLLCGEPPFIDTTRVKLLKKVLTSKVTFTQPIWATISDTAAKTVLTCLLKVDPAYRMSANQLLENPWITGDTNASAVPFNMREMIRRCWEQESMQTSDVSLLISSQENKEPLPGHLAVSRETDRTVPSMAPAVDKRDNCSNKPSTSTKRSHGMQTKGSDDSLQQDKQIKSSDTSGQPPTNRPGAKQRRPQDKKDLKTGRKSSAKPKQSR